MFDCVMPAAGASSRMLSPEGMPILKPLLPFGSSTLAETAAAAAFEAGCRVLLVAGHHREEVAALFGAGAYSARRARGELLLVPNPRWEEGLLGSIQAALPSVRGEAFFVALADMPFVSSGAYLALADAWGERAARGLPEAAIFASHGGELGHPVLLPSAWAPEMLGLDSSGAMRDFLAARPAQLVETGPGALRDIDTPRDYEAALGSG